LGANLGLIEKIGILEDQIYFLPSQMIQIKGNIARTSQPMIILEKTLNSRDPID
jgi:hypothetical protein